MDLNSSDVFLALTPYLRLFYYVGHIPWPDNFREESNSLRRLFFSTNIWCFTLHLGVITTGEVLKNVVPEFRGNDSNLIVQLYFTLEFASCVAIFLQPLQHQRAIGQIIRSFQQIGDALPPGANYSIEMRSAIRKSGHKIWMFLFSYGLNLFLHIHRLSRSFQDEFVDFILLVLQTTTVFGAALAVLFIDLLNFHLDQLTGIVRRQSGTGAHEQLECLKCVKLLHLELWETTQEVNRFFGWGFGAIFIRNFTEASFIMYGMFVIVSDDGNDTWSPFLREFSWPPRELRC